MNAKEAIEIIAHNKKYGHKTWAIEAQDIKNRIGFKNETWLEIASIAEGYLAALEGPEVKALVEALEKINENCHGDSVVYSRVALSQFREAIKQEKI